MKIELRLTDLIGKGLHRECYVHPHDANLCIKVVVNGGNDESQREQGYYQLLQCRNIAWDMLPRFHGVVDCNLGSGAVFDLIRDADGSVSKTLEYYLSSAQLTDTNYQGLLNSLCLLKDYLIDQNVITMTIKPKNITYKKNNNKHALCVIVDNIGNSDFVPISSYSRFFGRKKILRKWIRFIAALKHDYPDNQALQTILTELRVTGHA